MPATRLFCSEHPRTIVFFQSPEGYGGRSSHLVMKPLIFSSVLFFGLGLSAPAFADDEQPSSADIKRAATSYDLGRERYRDANYVEAAEHFESADDSAPSAAALRMAMLSRKEGGNLSRALTHAALALELYPNDSKLSEEAQALIDEEGGAFGKVNVSCDSPCELLLDGRIVHGAASERRLIYVPPGSITVRASWPGGRSATEKTDVYSEGTRELDFYAPAPDEKPVTAIAATTDSNEEEQKVEDEPTERDGWHPAVFWTGLGLTAAGAIATTALGVNAINSPGADAVTQGCAPFEIDCPLLQQGRRNQAYANVALGVTLAFGAFTITSAFFTDWGKPGSEKESEDKPAKKGDGYDGWSNDTWSYRDGDLFIQPALTLGGGATLGAVGTF